MSDFEVSFYTCHDGGKPAKDFMKTQKTPPAEIERAKKNRKDYCERMDDK